MVKKKRVGAGQEPSSDKASEGERGDEKGEKARPAENSGATKKKERAQIDETSLEDQMVDAVSEAVAEEEENLAQEYLDHLQRLQAEFANYRKRAQKELIEAYDYAKAELMCKLLPVIDDLERAVESLDSSCNSEEALKGVKLIYAKLKFALQAEGLEAIQCRGKRFDPNLHEAVVVTQVNEGADNEIIKDFQKGYTFKGKLVRPSKVEVAQIESDQGDE